MAITDKGFVFEDMKEEDWEGYNSLPDFAKRKLPILTVAQSSFMRKHGISKRHYYMFGAVFFKEFKGRQCCFWYDKFVGFVD